MDFFIFGFSIQRYVIIKNVKSIGAMKVFSWPFENRRFLRKTLVFPHINENLGETFPQILIYLENSNAFSGRLRSLDPQNLRFAMY